MIKTIVRHVAPHQEGPLVRSAGQRHCRRADHSRRRPLRAKKAIKGEAVILPEMTARCASTRCTRGQNRGTHPVPLVPPCPLPECAMLPAGGSFAADYGGRIGRTRRLIMHCALQLLSLAAVILAPQLIGVTATVPDGEEARGAREVRISPPPTVVDRPTSWA